MAGQKYIPYKGLNTDISNQLMPPDQARFIKNLVYSLDDASLASDSKSSQEGVFKPLQSTVPYIDNISIPAEDQSIGYLSVKETKEVYVNIYDPNGSHIIYKLNGYDNTYDIVYKGPLLDFKLNPENFIHQGGSYLEILPISDPLTGQQVNRKFYMFTDGNGIQKQICVEDSIATNGFDPTKFDYFKGSYDPQVAICMGVPTPSDCIQITEIPRTAADASLPNNLLFNVWYFRVTYIDVWGRPSEHGIISDAYVPGINDCIGASASIPRCLNLTFKAPHPFINAVQVEFMKCGDSQWSISDTLFLYAGSNLGNWWERQRNPLINYNHSDNTITYTFCRDKECQPVPIAETSRLYNPMPRTSQGVAKIGEYVSLTNNKYGFLPFTDEHRNAIKFTVIPPSKGSINTASIDILVPIYNPALNNFQSVFKNGTTNYEWGDNNSKHGGANAYSQYFKNPNQSGFGGYLVGQGNFVISTQWYLDPAGNLVQDKALDGKGVSPNSPTFLRFQFYNVPKGNYIFRLMSHLADPTVDVGWEKTSTTVWGICDFKAAGYVVSPQKRRAIQELQINVCNGNYSTLNDTKILVICDLAAFDPNAGKNLGLLFGGFGINTGASFRATCGYVYETASNGYDQNPMELIKVSNPHALSYSDYLTNIGTIGLIGLGNPFATSTFTCLCTDHNGFYYYSTEGTDFTFAFDLYNKCQKVQFTLGTFGNTQGLQFNPAFIIDQFSVNGVYKWSDYYKTVCNRVNITGKVVLSNTGSGIPNVVVSLTRGQSTTTDSNGNFSLIAHDDILNGTRADQIIISASGCGYTAPDGGCIEIKNVSFSPCISCVARTVTVGDFLLYYLSKRGLLSGGTYAPGVVGWDWAKRCGFVQPLDNIQIPTITESGTIAPSTIEVEIDQSVVFPSDFTELTIWLTRELTIDSYIDWIVDQVEFIDNTGSINATSPTQIRIYYASIVEYNKQNNFNTTATWDFLEPLPSTAAVGTAQTPYQRDTVQFFINGDGTFFFDGQAHSISDTPKNITALVKYDQSGQYFLIDYDSSLAGLLPNALIRLSRPRVCTGNEEYFEICYPIELVNGKAAVSKFILNAFDTYYLPRTIPVPTPVNPSNATTIATTTKTVGNSDGSQTVTTKTINETVNTVNEQRQFGFRFESNAPSNFWGKGCFNGGRGNAKNPYETVIYNIDEIALSGSVSINSQLNYLNYFDDSQKFRYPGLNGIVGIYPQSGMAMVLGQSDCFVIGYNDNIVRVNDQGQAIAPSIANTFGKPASKVGKDFGCQLFDKNSIAIFDGRILWVDTQRASLVMHDYREPEPISQNGMNGYFMPKIKSVQQFNNSGKGTRYFHGVISPINNEYLLSDFIIGSNNFINDELDYDVDVPETIGVGIFTKQFKAQYKFVPEMFAYLEGDINGQQLFSFTNGKPWRHYQSTGPVTYGNVYGYPARRNFRIVSAADPLKKKKFLSAQVYCKQGAYFCSNVMTEIGQVSRTLLPNITAADYGYYFPFLCDLNTLPNLNTPNETGKNVLMDGDMLVGLWADIDFVGDPVYDQVYSELDGVVINFAASEKSGT